MNAHELFIQQVHIQNHMDELNRLQRRNGNGNATHGTSSTESLPSVDFEEIEREYQTRVSEMKKDHASRVAKMNSDYTTRVAEMNARFATRRAEMLKS